jgi:hypothetical protein
MTTVGMPGHGFTFPVEGIVPVIFSSMAFSQFIAGDNKIFHVRHVIIILVQAT